MTTASTIAPSMPTVTVAMTTVATPAISQAVVTVSTATVKTSVGLPAPLLSAPKVSYTVVPVSASSSSQLQQTHQKMQQLQQLQQLQPQQQMNRRFKHEWDSSVYEDALEVRCKDTDAIIYKSKFGSGGRGKCVKVGETWMTPNDYEAFAGRASSKDWKRSVRFKGHPLGHLVEDGLLVPHSSSCNCSNCTNDPKSVEPIKLHVPPKRRTPKAANHREPSSGSAAAAAILAMRKALDAKEPISRIAQKTVEPPQTESSEKENSAQVTAPEALTSSLGSNPAFALGGMLPSTAGVPFALPPMTQPIVSQSSDNDSDALDASTISELRSATEMLMAQIDEIKGQLNVQMNGSEEEKDALRSKLRSETSTNVNKPIGEKLNRLEEMAAKRKGLNVAGMGVSGMSLMAIPGMVPGIMPGIPSGIPGMLPTGITGVLPTGMPVNMSSAFSTNIPGGIPGVAPMAVVSSGISSGGSTTALAASTSYGEKSTALTPFMATPAVPTQAPFSTVPTLAPAEMPTLVPFADVSHGSVPALASAGGMFAPGSVPGFAGPGGFFINAAGTPMAFGGMSQISGQGASPSVSGPSISGSVVVSTPLTISSISI